MREFPPNGMSRCERAQHINSGKVRLNHRRLLKASVVKMGCFIVFMESKECQEGTDRPYLPQQLLL